VGSLLCHVQILADGAARVQVGFVGVPACSCGASMTLPDDLE
jgi:hypothetical protein